MKDALVIQNCNLFRFLQICIFRDSLSIFRVTAAPFQCYIAMLAYISTII